MLDVYSDPHTPIDVLKANLATLSHDEKQQLASGPKASENLQLLLAVDESVDIQSSLARNPACCDAALLRLADLDNEHVLDSLLHREPFISEAIQLKLASYGDGDFERDLAQMAQVANLPLSDAHSLVPVLLKRYRLKALKLLAQHPAISPATQMQLAQQQFICNEGARHVSQERISQDEYQRRMRDEGLQIREAQSQYRDMVCALASNPQISEETQLFIAQSDLSAHHDSYRAYIARSALATNPSINPTLQMRLANDYFGMHASLARNPNLDPEIQLRLVKDCDWSVRTNLIANPSITEATQLKIIKHRDKFYREELLKAPHFKTHLKRKLGDLYLGELNGIAARIKPSVVYSEEQQLRWANAKDTRVRVALARNAHLTEAVQLKLAHDYEHHVRKALLPNLTPKVREALGLRNREKALRDNAIALQQIAECRAKERASSNLAIALLRLLGSIIRRVLAKFRK